MIDVSRMRVLALCALSLVVTMGVAPASHDDAPASAEPPPDTLTTAYDAAGIRVIQRLSPGATVVAARLYLLGGTRQITERTEGLEALLLAAAAYGTTGFPGDDDRRALDRTGAVVIAEPEVDWSVLGLTALIGDFDAAWRPFADRLAHPTLSDESIARARAQLLTAAHRRYTRPDAELQALAMRSLFHGHPYSLDPGGTETSLAALSPDDVRSYAREQLVTSRMLLAIVGDVSRAHVESLVTATLGQLPRGTYHWILPPPPPRSHAHWLVEQRDIPTAYMLGLFAGPPPTSGDYWAFRVATALLSSRLHVAIRSERSLSYAAFAPYLELAIPVGGSYVSTPKPDEALPLIVGQIEELERRSLNAFALDRFLDTFSFEYIARNTTSDGQADFLARAELYLGSYKNGAEFVKRLHRVSSFGVQDAAARYMTAIQYAYLGDTSRMHGHW